MPLNKETKPNHYDQDAIQGQFFEESKAGFNP